MVTGASPRLSWTVRLFPVPGLIAGDMTDYHRYAPLLAVALCKATRFERLRFSQDSRQLIDNFWPRLPVPDLKLCIDYVESPSRQPIAIRAAAI